MTMQETIIEPRREGDHWVYDLGGNFGTLTVPVDVIPDEQAKELLRRFKLPEQRPDRHPHVIAALAAVMAEMPGVGKTERSEQGYQYRGIEAITQHVQHLLGKHGVVFVPRVLERHVTELTINNRPWTQDELKIEYTVYGPGGVDDHITIGPLWGLGRDNSDKGVNKAMTQAFKYALIQTLCIGDAKDDADREEAHQADARNQPDPEDEARRDGWDGLADFQAHRAEVRPYLRKLVDAGVLSHEAGGTMWAEYQRPDGPDRPARPRSKAEHEVFMRELPPPPAQEPPGGSEAPAGDQAPPEAPEADTSEAGGATEPSNAPEPAGRPEQPPTFVDNGYRDDLDELLATGSVDDLVARLKRMPVTEVTTRLDQRGAAAPPARADELRARLVRLLVAVRVTDTAAEASAAPPAGRE